MLYPLFQNGFYGFSGGCEIIFKNVTGQEDISISQQDIGKQRGLFESYSLIKDHV